MTDEEANRWLFEEGNWVPSSYLVPILGDDAANQLARWASTDDGKNPILRTRARIFEARREDGSLIGPRTRELHSWFWSAAPVESNCLAGNFERKENTTLMIAVGVQINKDDLNDIIGDLDAPRPTTAFTQKLDSDGRATLPLNATSSNRRDEEYAHRAAERVRQGVKLSEAIRDVAPDDPTRAPESVASGIRRTFGLMYDRNGYPISIQN